MDGSLFSKRSIHPLLGLTRPACSYQRVRAAAVPVPAVNTHLAAREAKLHALGD